ncbi:MAG: tRNA pseudouridine(38-40) synthase TruA [Gammaproteobacteria bacterium]
MARIAIGLQYDGTNFCGWQKQRDLRSVQSCVEQALSRIADKPVAVVCAGRTDAGVHATGQVIHFDTQAERPGHAWVLGGNRYLPNDINILWSRQTSEDFHARFNAASRSYSYFVLNRRERSSLHRHRAYWVHRSLDHKAMGEAARHLTGRHDFSSFRSASCQARTTERTIHSIAVERDADVIRIEVTANAFLQHMVRNIVGVLVRIGSGEAPASWMQEVLGARDRIKAATTTPAAGLYLVQVSYPEKYAIPVARQTMPGMPL